MTILADIQAPTWWRRERLDRVVSRSRQAGDGSAQPLSVFLTDGVVPRSERLDENRNQLGDDLSKYLLVRPGDVVFNKLRTWQGGLGVSDHHGIVSPAYFVCRLIEKVTPRFLHYLLRSKPYLDEFTRISKWMPPSQFDISWDQLRNVLVLLPPLDEQWAIADFLDAETARIDGIVSKRVWQLELLEGRRWAAFIEAVLGGSQLTTAPLRRFITQLTDGPFGSAFSSSDYSQEGAAVVRLGNIGFADFRGLDLVARIPMSMFGTFRRHEVRQGDLLIAGLGDDRNHAGRACVAPALGPAIVKGKCFRGRATEGLADADFLAAYLSSPLGAEAVRTETRGSTRTMINLEIAKSLQIPMLPVAQQTEIVSQWRRENHALQQLLGNIRRQIDLLQEHRQALITAAVTGEIDMSTASRRGVPA